MPPETIIPALSLHQPWATLIAAGVKKQETRSWPPSTRYILRDIAIHAAKVRSDEAVADFAVELENEIVPLGAVVAIARLRGAWKVEELTASEPVGPVTHAHPVKTPACLVYRGNLEMEGYARIDDYGDWSEGRWIWEFDRVQKIGPVPCRGHQGIWRVPKEVHAELKLIRQRWLLHRGETQQGV